MYAYIFLLEEIVSVGNKCHFDVMWPRLQITNETRNISGEI